MTWLQVPAEGAPTLPPDFLFTSVYVSNADETQVFIDAPDAEVALILSHADLIIGHQVSSDLAVLCNASQRPLHAIQQLRSCWHSRRDTGPVPW